MALSCIVYEIMVENREIFISHLYLATVASPAVGGWGAKEMESGGIQSPSGVQGQSPDGCLGAKQYYSFYVLITL